MKRKLAKMLSVFIVLTMVFSSAEMVSYAASVSSTSITSISNTYQGVKLKWKKVSKANGYRIYKKVGSSGKWKKLKDVTSTDYVDKSVSNTKKYYYRIKAYKGSKKKTFSAYSRISSKTFISAPEIKSVTENYAGAVIKFNKVNKATKYIVYRKTGKNGTYKQIGITKKLKYVDETCLSFKTYYYSVVAQSSSNAKSGKSKGSKIKITYYGGDCARNGHPEAKKTVVPPTSVLCGYTLHTCKCGAYGYYSNVKNPKGENHPSGNDFAYSEAVKRDNESVKYLNTILKKDKVNLLQVYDGTTEDLRVLKKFADNIVKDCKTDYEKIKAIYDWTINNVTYDTAVSQYSVDVMRSKRGDCEGMTLFICDALRLENIPCATVIGYVGDMKSTLTENNMAYLSGDTKHQWIRAYDGEKWVFADPTFERFDPSKKECEIPAWYYSIATDYVEPYYKNMNLKMNGLYPMHMNGHYYYLAKNKKEFGVSGTGVFSGYYVEFRANSASIVDKQKTLRDLSVYKSNKKYRLDEFVSDDVCYTLGSTPSNTSYNYQTYYNGRIPHYVTLSQGKRNYIDSATTYKNYSGKYLSSYGNAICLQVGDTIDFDVLLGDVKWSSEDKSIATVDKNGKVTAKKTGYVNIEYKDSTQRRRFESSVFIYIKNDKNYKIKSSDMAPASSIKTQRSKIKKIETKKMPE